MRLACLLALILPCGKRGTLRLENGWWKIGHLAFEYPGENASNEWCEPVTDEEYDAL